jgi:hypothetical protein
MKSKYKPLSKNQIVGIQIVGTPFHFRTTVGRMDESHTLLIKGVGYGCDEKPVSLALRDAIADIENQRKQNCAQFGVPKTLSCESIVTCGITTEYQLKVTII